MPGDTYDGSWGDFTSQFAPELGGVYNNTSYDSFLSGLGTSLGFEGSLTEDAPWMMQGVHDNPDEYMWGQGQQITPEFQNLLSQLKFTPVQPQGNHVTTNVMRGRQNLGNFEYGDSGGMMDIFAPMVIGSLVTGGFGSGLGSMFSGLGAGGASSALGQGLASGGMTAARGGSGKEALTSAFTSALGSGVGSLNPAKMIGMDPGILSKMFNSAVGGGVSSAVRGASGQDVLTSALSSALSTGATQGLNSMSSFFGDQFNQLFGGEGAKAEMGDVGDMGDFGGLSLEYPDAPGELSFGDYAQPTDVSFDFDQSIPGVEWSQGTTLPDDVYGQKQATSSGSVGEGISFGASLGNLGSSLGRFVGNNFGDLATGLYGMYNNRKQQKAIQAQINNLQQLFGPNSPYAQQARARMEAQAAARGTRSNVAGRETQLAALLADRQAQLAPQMYNMQQGKNLLQNRMMGNLLNMGNQTGAFKSLGQMFQQNPLMGANVSGQTNMFGSDKIFDGWQ